MDVWEYVGTLEKAEEYKWAYVTVIYDTYHSKACLTTEDYTEQATGATISKKTWREAANKGLLPLLAWPASFLYVNGAKLLGNGNLTGESILASLIIVTFVLRFVIALLTMKSTKQQQMIQKMQPEMEAINQKYANKFDEKSKQMKSMEIMKLYRKYNVNPMASLITPFITLPVFIAVYSAVQHSSAIYDREIFGLSLGAKLGKSVLSPHWFAIVVFIVMGLSQFVTMRLTTWLNKKKQKSYKQPKTNGMSQTDMMMYFFLVMILIIGWSLPIALSIYWISSSLYSIVQTFVLDYLSNKKGK